MPCCIRKHRAILSKRAWSDEQRHRVRDEIIQSHATVRRYWLGQLRRRGVTVRRQKCRRILGETKRRLGTRALLTCSSPQPFCERISSEAELNLTSSCAVRLLTKAPSFNAGNLSILYSLCSNIVRFFRQSSHSPLLPPSVRPL